MNSEQQIFTLILHSGNGRSFAMEALAFARKNDFESAQDSIQKAKDELVLAHHIQTELIQGEIRGEKADISLLMVHAQDHLMNAITVKDLAEEFVSMYERFETIRNVNS
ncbi:PTS lactose/cellobiose transporter subunit IIA [Niallia sp. NCCP-28]|uniref:PTS lactose/cellobiose transporter subunit IIA n=1 Tax=Niallia sp. NCCP-28 TaxID=2934712 RepID=UPI00207E0A86|nr:PTS lactose/cellobiose transporter subunit IIA [Niallia sp. NCCP-28]GKU84856.1 PTS cellobiose transporter subunit IIA [Niallia sp. NCCP-28]